MEAADATLRHEFLDAVVVKHTDDDFDGCFQKWAHSSDEIQVGFLEAIVGRYWKVGILHNQACFKKEAAVGDGGEDNPFFFFYSAKQKGWVVGLSMTEVNDETMVAWCPEAKDHGLPEHLHLPFWASKATPLVAWDPGPRI